VLLSVLPAWFWIGVFAAFGLVFGSFGNVLIARLPKEQSLRGRSACPRCGATIRLYDLIPVFSFIALEGRCRDCRSPIAIRYPLIELASGALFAAALALFPMDLIAAAFTAFGLWALLLIAVIDAETQSIPDVLTLTVGIAGLALHLWAGDAGIVAPLVGLAFFGSQWAFSKGKWVGSGDVLLAAAMGFFVGSWRLMLVALMLALMLAYIIGAAFVIVQMLLQNTKPGQSVAFGPFLVLGAALAFAWGERMLMVLFPGL
jgi:leader peptidase (prepilin peptidase) / N-methyltransferase